MTGISQDLQVLTDASVKLAQGAADLQREAAGMRALEGLVPWLAGYNVLLEVMREAYIFATSWFEETLLQDAAVLQHAADGLASWAADLAAAEEAAVVQATVITDVLSE